MIRDRYILQELTPHVMGIKRIGYRNYNPLWYYFHQYVRLDDAIYVQRFMEYTLGRPCRITYKSRKEFLPI